MDRFIWAISCVILFFTIMCKSIAAPYLEKPANSSKLNFTSQTNDQEMIEVTWDKLNDLSSHKCKISTPKDLHQLMLTAEDREAVNLFQFTIHLRDYSPFTNVSGLYFKPWLWYTTKNQHGRTLLMLSFHYDVLSMNILTIGVKKADIELRDNPFGCFGNLSTGEQVSVVRMILLSRIDKDKVNPSERFACNQEITDIGGNADFVYNCCSTDGHNNFTCSNRADDFWINILYLAITSVKVLIFLFCAKFLPENAYSAAYALSEYVLKLKKPFYLKVFVTENMDSTMTAKTKIDFKQITNWSRFRNFLKTIPLDETFTVTVSKLRIKVKGKRIIPEYDPPVGLLKTMYDNLIRCKIRALGPLEPCCETNIFTFLGENTRHFMQWQKLVLLIIKALLLAAIPLPFYIRLIIYYKFEAEELTQRRLAREANGLDETFSFYRTNVIQYLSPTHAIFVTTYILYFLIGVIIGFASPSFRNKLRDICKSSLQDMNAVSQTEVLGMMVQACTYPFKRWGLLGFLVAPIYLTLVLPACLLYFIIYCVPTIYLTYKLPYHAKQLASRQPQNVKGGRKKIVSKLQHYGKKWQKIDQAVHAEDEVTPVDDNHCCPDDMGCYGCVTFRSVSLQVVTAIFCLCILYSVALLFSESIGLFIEVMAFTMMGIIINAGNVLKYVSMVLLVFVYMNDCYSNVYENYLSLNKFVIEEFSERTSAELKSIASQSADVQENTAFQMKCIDEKKERPPRIHFKDGEIQWDIGQPLLFLDKFDTPRIPLRLFQRLCQVQVYGAPGPVYLSLLMATGKFMIIVVFLMFVMIVVMAFGNVYAVSSTNSTLATLAGGFIPMLLKNVLSSRGARISLKTVSFKGQMDEVINEYKQNWPLADLEAKKYVPGEEDGEEEKNKEDEIRSNNDKCDDQKKINEKIIDHKENTNAFFFNGNGDATTLNHEEPEVDLFLQLTPDVTDTWSVYHSSEDNTSTGSRFFEPADVQPNMYRSDSIDEGYSRQSRGLNMMANVAPFVVMYAHAKDEH